ncbi:DUF1523 family protein [Pseudoprimorskyibacter insulae]|uniref:DUF1523 domain-containing protein n=1 Tax=Pseudoprimorskyibacter insulae TaxID=1695997 RepID=A0A2R8ATV6_9RHOB|nr:DUF1523 family protein [Pseudoprimorskyibacter insulae]SPF79465.1 hypothetical protein PRI8871_01261 [Pseudoprimorskyibacter insulae]
MTYVKWIFAILFWGLVAAFFHYTLPQHDVAQIVGTENRRIDFGENSIFWAAPDAGTAAGANRDVFFIQTRTPDGNVMVYRNEDTGWGWPPYFKFDTSNLQAEAQSLVSTSGAPQWVVVTHYGWRNEFLTIFPNAIGVKAVDRPDLNIIPWLNIIILTVFFAIVWAIWSRWRRFRRNRIDPVLEDVGDSFEAAGDSFAEKRGRFSRWIDSWRSKTR